MSDVLDKLKKKVLGEFFSKIETVDSQAYKALSKEDKREYEIDENNYSRKVPIDISEDEEQRVINLKILQLVYKAQKDISEMKNIMTFWFVLTLFGLIGTIIMLANR